MRRRATRRTRSDCSRATTGKRSRPLVANLLRTLRFFDLLSGRRDSNPRRHPWQGCTLPLSYSRETPRLIYSGDLALSTSLPGAQVAHGGRSAAALLLHAGGVRGVA